ncbi:uncharacterized protein LOC121369026 [Gigantopelta aegis]|uniref:uncharacterized protein LOC121369026 n=1 Tax=Gigantopelta aegis TaxID=1735272 RepID=UPI001B88BB18|nr:uncharacterized protein LOC121369026 [Gigantopelta aegis]
MKPDWGKSPRLVPFFPKFRSLPRTKKSFPRIQASQCRELDESRRRTDAFDMQTSAYLRKLELERDRDKEIQTKSLHNIPIQIRRMARLGSGLSVDSNCPDHRKADTVQGFTRQTVVLPKIMSKQRQQATCSDGRWETKSMKDGSETGSTTDHSCQEYHSEGEIYTSGADIYTSGADIYTSGAEIYTSGVNYASRNDSDLCGLADVPYKCRRLCAVKNNTKKKRQVKSYCPIPIKQTLALQLDRARCRALDKHVHFVNSSCIAGQKVYRTDRMSIFDTPRMMHRDDRPSLASRLQLMAIASVQEHNLPEMQEQTGPENSSVG